LFALLVGPDGDGFFALCNHTAERFRGVRGRQSTRELSPFGGKSVFETMDQEFFESGEIRAIVEFGSVE
jgi:hypothetical protein